MAPTQMLGDEELVGPGGSSLAADPTVTHQQKRKTEEED